MLTTIYYIIGILLLIGQIIILTKYNGLSKLEEWSKAVKKITGNSPEVNSYTASQIKWIFFLFIYYIMYILWFFVGLFSGLWKIYLLMIGITTLIVCISAFFKNVLIKLFFSYLTIFIRIIFIFVIVANHFYWNLNATELFRHIF
jgi:hypothetical protein